MTDFSKYSDPSSNAAFTRDWGDGPVQIKLRSEKSKPARPTAKPTSTEAAEPEATA